MIQSIIVLKEIYQRDKYGYVVMLTFFCCSCFVNKKKLETNRKNVSFVNPLVRCQTV